MRSIADRIEINNFLGRAGLATLDNPGGMLQHLGFLVEGHDHFRSLLLRCQPEYRRDMYEALRPHLRFEPKPLDVYLAEAGQDAEARQLPTIGANGELVPFKPAPEIVTESPHLVDGATPNPDLLSAQVAVNEAFATKRLMLTCPRCTKEGVFTGDSRTDAWLHARSEGWRYVIGTGDLCPECAELAKRN